MSTHLGEAAQWIEFRNQNDTQPIGTRPWFNLDDGSLQTYSSKLSFKFFSITLIILASGVSIMIVRAYVENINNG